MSLSSDATSPHPEIGKQLGPYRLESRLGAGGMGTVYRGLDTRLGRPVAVKVSKERFAARLENEARAVSALNHPHIATLYDVGPDYLVMELVEGETLDARLRRGPLSVESVLRYGAEIAAALAAAHAKGIIHRDLKPGNVMITKSGIKVLDFGLARFHAHVDETVTATGVVMGTPGYMAPEQLASAACTPRTDIYALGLMLYEMATAERLPRRQAPRLPGFPPALQHTAERCLQEDPDDRWQNARDLQAELEWTAESGAPVEAVASHSSAGKCIAAAGILVAAIAVVWALTRNHVPGIAASPLRLHWAESAAGLPALSPDGKSVAFPATLNGKNGIWVRPLNGDPTWLLPGTERAIDPVWSPDGKTIGFNTDQQLFRVELAGGAPVPICKIPGSPRGMTWTNDGRILFAGAPTPLFEVPVSGGSPAPFTALDRSRGETVHIWPQSIPGNHFLYYAFSDIPENAGVYAASLTKPREAVKLVTSDSSARYTTGGDGLGYLLWSRAGTLVAQRFDAAALRLSGEPHPLADGVGISLLKRLLVTVSDNGLLLYSEPQKGQLTWLDTEGKVAGTVGEPDILRDFEPSPDERRMIVSRPRTGSGFDLWMLETARGISTRFTTGTGSLVDPIWSPDGRTIVYTHVPDELLRKASDGLGGEQVIVRTPNLKHSTDWSRDGKYLMYFEVDPETKYDLWVLPMATDGNSSEPATPRAYLRTQFAETNGSFSPEPTPHWVVYQSDESGRNEVYVRGFPEAGEKIRVSTNGGVQPRWSPVSSGDKLTLFYTSPTRKLMTVDLKLTNGSVAPGPPHELFALPQSINGIYRVSANGRRFLVQTDEPRPPATVLVNWTALLK